MHERYERTLHSKFVRVSLFLSSTINRFVRRTRFFQRTSLALIYRKCIDYESRPIRAASIGRSVEGKEKVSTKLRRNIRFYLFYLAVFIHPRAINKQPSVSYIEFSRYRYNRFCCNDRRRRRRLTARWCPRISTEIGRRRRETDCRDSAHFRRRTLLRSISLFFEAIKRDTKRLAVRRPD